MGEPGLKSDLRYNLNDNLLGIIGVTKTTYDLYIHKHIYIYIKNVYYIHIYYIYLYIYIYRYRFIYMGNSTKSWSSPREYSFCSFH